VTINLPQKKITRQTRIIELKRTNVWHLPSTDDGKNLLNCFQAQSSRLNLLISKRPAILDPK
jgi:hypothetical protein